MFGMLMSDPSLKSRRPEGGVCRGGCAPSPRKDGPRIVFVVSSYP